MSIGQVITILWRRGWILLLSLLTSLVVVVGVLLFVPSRYDATATASIDPGDLDPVAERGIGASSVSIGLMQGNMLQLVSSERVALDVVRRLNLTASRTAQEQYRNSNSFGRESIDNWLAASLLKNVDPKFTIGSDVLSIKYKADDPNQAALICNAFLAATIDAAIAMKAAEGEQTARWFAPQLAEIRKSLDAARNELETFQKQTNLVAPTNVVDAESSTLMALTQELSSNRATLTVLESRLSSGSTNLSSDPSDPDLQLLATLKEKITTGESELEAAKSSLGANNPKMQLATASVASLRKQIADATAKMRDHLSERIASTKDQIAKLETAQAAAQKTLIDAQGQRYRLGELQRDVAFLEEQLNERERMAAQAKLQSKLTFANITVLDKATPPIEPAFPKPTIIIPVGVAAGLALGLILALLAEMTDRRVRSVDDLELATSAPVLGVVYAQSRRGALLGGPRRLRAA